jgi:hypothetical protein
MPVRRIKPERPQGHPELVKAISDELQITTEPPLPGSPIIIEETIGPGPFMHVTVIWERWEGIPAEERGHVIMDGYSDYYDQSTVGRISVALGLTPDEAKKLDIEF